MLESTQTLRTQLRALTDELFVFMYFKGLSFHEYIHSDQKSLALEHLMVDDAKNKQTIATLNAKVWHFAQPYI